MLNKSTSRSEYVIQSGVTQYPVGFEFLYNGDDTPQIRVTIGAMVATENLHFVITEDLLNIKLIPLEEEAPEDPNDYSWLEKWVGMSLVIERDIPFVQESDYQVGRISPERIEKDFDLSVMRDQILDTKNEQLRKDMDDEFAAVDSRFDFVQEQMDNEFRDVRDEFAEADKGLYDKIGEASKDLTDKIGETKAELQKSIDDKLPLSGGTLTGSLTIVGTENLTSRVLILKQGETGVGHTVVVADSGVQMPFRLMGMHSIIPSMFDGPHYLGGRSNKWGTVYTTKISNGSDISIPEKAGTMALQEDVENKADKTELSNYLPLTGGSFMSSWIGFDGVFGANVNRGIITVNTAAGVKGLIGAATDENGKLKDIAVIDKLKGTTVQYTNVLATQIGSVTSPIPRVFAKKIGSANSNKMIVIPEKAGTMACLDDIPETYTKEELDAKFAEIPEAVDAYTKAEVDAKLSSVYKFKGSVASVDVLPTDAIVGDTYNVEDTGANYAWDGSNWDKLSDTIDLTGYATEEYVDDNVFALMDYIDDEIRPLRTENKQLYNNQLVLRDMLNEKDENEEFIQLTTESQTAIPAINELNEKKASKEDLSGYLPLSGGEVDGRIEFYAMDTEAGLLFRDRVGSTDGAKIYGGSPYCLTVDLGIMKNGNIYFGNYGGFSSSKLPLGDPTYPWKLAYIEKLNNGADLIVPTEGGTLARLEDLEGIGGGDYLPLSGGTVAGELSLEGVGYRPVNLTLKNTEHNRTCRLGVNYVGQLTFSFSDNSSDEFIFSPNGSIQSTGYDRQLGSVYHPWKKTYCEKLNNGADLIVPTEGGTLARIEDIDERIGDISTALTAILGE